MGMVGIAFFDDPIAALTNIQRQLKPDARAAFITWQPLLSMKWHPVHFLIKYLTPRDEDATNKKKLTGSLSDAAFVKKMLSTAGFCDIRVDEYNIDADVPAETDIPAPTLVGRVDPAHRDTVLREWHETRARLTNDRVMQLDLRMYLITARVPQ